MSLKVLLADDNITAQKMGTKILSDAGYEVVAVSNGAAAVKKIASEKPAIVILDVYMPGYTGLEVCDKVKNARETARVPVLLTITRMEPFNPEDGNRVKADGVLVKPFEATDLLAVLRKLEEQIKSAPAVEPVKAAKHAADDEPEWNPEVERTKYAEMPVEIGSAPMMGLDELSPATADHSAPPASDAASSDTQFIDLPAFGIEPGAISPELPPTASAEGAPAIAPLPGLEPTSAPPVPLPNLPVATELQTTMQETAGDVAIARDPALATDPSDFSEFVTKFGTSSVGDDTAEISVPEISIEEPPSSESQPEAATEVEPEAASIGEPNAGAAPLGFSTVDVSTNALIEAPAEALPAASDTADAAGDDTAFVMREMVEEAMAMAASAASQSPTADFSAAAEAVPAREPEFGPETQPIDILPPRISSAPADSFGREQDAAEIARHLMADFAAELKAQQGAPPPATEPAPPRPTPADEHRIAAAVDRVLERYKGQLIAAIVRELEE